MTVVTTAGILGPPERAREMSALSEGLSIEWGVDSVTEAVSRATANPIDLLITDASVAFLVDDVLSLIPRSVGRIVAVADSELVFEWANSLPGVTAVRNFGDINSIVGDASRPSAETADSSDGVSPGRVVAVWGPVGAPGATTTAISLATVCAQAGLRTMLCDVDTRGSAVAIALGVMDETPGFAAACRLAGRGELTDDDIDRVTSRVHREGVSFAALTGLPRASRWAEVAPHKAKAVVTMLRAKFDAVIFDVGFGIEENEWVDDAPQRDGTTREILRLADAVVAVGATDAVSLSRVIRGLDDLRDLCSSPIVVLNRADRGSGSEASEAIHRFTNHRVRAVIPRDSRGGVHDAFGRARSQPAMWRDIAGFAGFTLPTSRRSRWRR